jgi:regulation of enolase protein 1 (concanavalin A-like superfamily)
MLMSKKSARLILCVSVITIALGGTVWADLVALWKFDEASGNVVADSSGNGIDGVLQGAAAIVNDAERGLVFQQNDVAANFIQIADPGKLLNFSATGPHQGSATTMAWVKSNGNWTSHDTIFSQGEWDDGIGLTIKADTSPAGQLWLAGDGTHATVQRSNVAVPTGGWHHVAATFAYNGTNTVITLYLDGEPTGFAEGTGNLPGRVTAPVGGISRIGLENRDGANPRWPLNGSIDDVAVFGTALSQAEVQGAMQGIGVQHGAASSPKPADGAEDVTGDVVLSWSAGEFAGTHNVYFGESFDDVNAADVGSPLGVLAKAGLDVNTYDAPGLLKFGKTYYWRVDEVNITADHTVFQGSVWSFTVEPYAYQLTGITARASSSGGAAMGPERTIDGSGLDAAGLLHGTTDTTMWVSNAAGPKPAWIEYDFHRLYKLQEMWVWNSNQSLEPFAGIGAKDVTIEYATDANDWQVLSGVPEFARAPGTVGYAHDTTVDFGGVAASKVKLTINSNWGGFMPQTGLSEVRFYYIPERAREPQPAAGATNVNPNKLTLRWRSGREAVLHQVFLSTDSNAVASGSALIDTASTNSYVLNALDLGRTYSWRVDEVNEAASPSLWQGDVWNFSTAESIMIDDFEDYTNDSPDRVFQSWRDGAGFSGDEFFPNGYAGNGTGAIVGYDPLLRDIMEKAIVHGGRQSMPLFYDNSSVAYSEAERTWTTPQNWTTNRADSLNLYFRGNPVGFLELSPSHILMNGTGTDIYSTADQGRFVYKQLSGDGTIIARVDRLDNVDVWSKAGVMIRNSLDPSSTWAYILWANTNGVRFQARPTLGGAGTSDTELGPPADQLAQHIPIWVKLERTGDQFKGYYSADGTNWTAMAWNPRTIAMNTDVYIGLAVTSHAAAAVTQAEFSGVDTTGNVTGSWQSVSLGVDQPVGNLPDTLYVRLEDSGSHKVTVVNTDSLAVAAGVWTQWGIPLSMFTSAGVQTDSISRMVIGVGDKNKPASDATGLIYIDDIGYGRAADQ